VARLWAGIDMGKGHHHCVVIDAEGRKLLSQRVANDEAALLELIAEVTRMAEHDVVWAVDLVDGGAVLLTALLLDRQQVVVYLPGRAVHRAAGMYRGEAKTDARDAAVIADQARMRRDLQQLTPADPIAADLRVLTAHRLDLAADRTRAINRLREQLLSYFPALERAFEYSRSKGVLTLLTGFRTPARIRELGESRLVSWLRILDVHFAARIGAAAVAAAAQQQSVLPGEAMASEMVRRSARTIQRLDQELAELDVLIASRFAEHRDAAIATSMSGIGQVLGAELIAVSGGDVLGFGRPDRLAAAAGLAPVPRDSGRISGNLRRPQRYSRRLLRIFYMSAQISIQHDPQSRAYYRRKRDEGKRHHGAVLALARRRVNVLWALLRDGQLYERNASQRSAPTIAAA
jgi:transposase